MTLFQVKISRVSKKHLFCFTSGINQYTIIKVKMYIVHDSGRKMLHMLNSCKIYTLVLTNYYIKVYFMDYLCINISKHLSRDLVYHVMSVLE